METDGPFEQSATGWVTDKSYRDLVALHVTDRGIRKMIKLDETVNEQPICPHCEGQITELLTQKVESGLGVRYIYFCQHCKKVLGVSQRKGFWMG